MMLLAYIGQSSLDFPPRRSPLVSEISTADVDPEYVVNYQPETADFPESPEHRSFEVAQVKSFSNLIA